MEDDKDSVQETIRYYRRTVLQEDRDSVQETIRYYRRTGTAYAYRRLGHTRTNVY